MEPSEEFEIRLEIKRELKLKEFEARERELEARKKRAQSSKIWNELALKYEKKRNESFRSQCP